jgi:hypothetical protein
LTSCSTSQQHTSLKWSFYTAAATAHLFVYQLTDLIWNDSRVHHRACQQSRASPPLLCGLFIANFSSYFYSI